MVWGSVNQSGKASRSSLRAAYFVRSPGAGLVGLEGSLNLLLLWSAALGGMVGARATLGLYCCMVSFLLAQLFLQEDPVIFRFSLEAGAGLSNASCDAPDIS